MSYTASVAAASLAASEESLEHVLKGKNRELTLNLLCGQIAPRRPWRETEFLLQSMSAVHRNEFGERDAASVVGARRADPPARVSETLSKGGRERLENVLVEESSGESDVHAGSDFEVGMLLLETNGVT